MKQFNKTAWEGKDIGHFQILQQPSHDLSVHNSTICVTQLHNSCSLFPSVQIFQVTLYQLLMIRSSYELSPISIKEKNHSEPILLSQNFLTFFYCLACTFLFLHLRMPSVNNIHSHILL